MPLNRTAAFTATAAAITLAGIALTGTAALATTPELGTIRGVDGKTVVLEWTVPASTWPQPVYDGSCAVTVQRDEYPYATEADRKRTDALAADGLLREGEDYGWAIRWEYVTVPACEPEPTSTPTATTPTEEPSSTPTPTSTPTSTPAPSPSPTGPATEPTPGPSTSPSSSPSSPAGPSSSPSAPTSSPSSPVVATAPSGSPSPVSASPVVKAAAATTPPADALAYTGSGTPDWAPAVGLSAVVGGICLLLGHAVGYGKGRKLRRDGRS